MGDVKIFTLMNGDKILGEIVEDETVHQGIIKIKKPILLKELFTQDGFSFAPIEFIPTTDEIVTINTHSMCSHPCTPKKELLDIYQSLNSKLVLPKSNNNLKLV